MPLSGFITTIDSSVECYVVDALFDIACTLEDLQDNSFSVY
jgi:hypothetical protein